MNRKQDKKVSSITTPRGFRAGGWACGIKASGKPDLAIIAADVPCTAAGVFTRNRVPGAPVIVGKRHIRTGSARAIVCNSGCSNVCTGEQGIEDARAMCSTLAGQLGCDPRDVLPASTGVIGHMLPMDKIKSGIVRYTPHLSRGPQADDAAARAILTTDLTPKHALQYVTLPGTDHRITLAGIAKGSGMIAPNMATMLAFLTTDAAISAPLLKQALRQAARVSFNRISVDEDTSTSDSVLILASGLAGNPAIDYENDAYAAFVDALVMLCRDLAYQIVADGEGATKVFRVTVINARSSRDADRVGKTIVGSPLVKTAVHGGDPNWGRLVAATGRSGAAVKPGQLTISINGIDVCRKGQPVAHHAGAQAKLDQAMQQREITFTIDLGYADGPHDPAEWLGCDLSKQYITINADYTT